MQSLDTHDAPPKPFPPSARGIAAAPGVATPTSHARGQPADLARRDGARYLKQAQAPVAPRATGKPPAPPATAPAADLQVAGFPVWLGKDGKLDRLVIVCEGFDLYNSYDAPALVQKALPICRLIWSAGLDVMVVDFPDGREAPDAQAPRLIHAIEAGAAASGRSVAVVGVSAGGITARWAMCDREAAGSPLPVRALLCVDSPHRGAWLNPALQAFATRYGQRVDREGVASPAARSLLQSQPARTRWRTVGAPVLPDVRRRVPTHWEENTTSFDDFMRKLHAKNERRGYPSGCPLYAIALGSRSAERATFDLLHLWLPLDHEWTLAAEPRDRQPGSLLPANIRDRLRRRVPLGLGGSYLRGFPAFIPTDSALDAGPTEKPPFNAFYARANGAPPIDHDQPDPGAAFFTLEILARAFATP